ncbi:MAG TPA: flagellar basal-body rod protein FlgF [Stellaceae bacterium]|jgi:flagellar basal-body rod protein FlgF|nr:flagellar basal-body rod protein FlgF [Stellaceae bacterium]
MQSTSYVSISQQTVLNRTMDIIANNLANASTTGYKEQQPLFKQFLTQGPSGQTVTYVQDAGTYRDQSQGDLTKTDNPLDFAIQGSGYFTVSTPNGDRFTRNGRFQIGKDGSIQTAQGYQVNSTLGKPIVIPGNAGTVSVANDGTVTDTQGNTLGRIAVVKFSQPTKLVSGANGLYVTDEKPAADATSTIRQGMVEGSNVKSIVELTRLMSLQQSFTSAQDMVQGEDTRIRNAIDKLSQAA